MNQLKSLVITINSLLSVDIRKRTRKREYVEARCIYFKMARDMYSATYDSIGRAIGLNHSTVMHGERTADDLIKVDRAFLEKYKIVKDYFGSFDEAGEYKSYLEILSENELLGNKVNELSLQLELIEHQAKKYHEFDKILDRIVQQVPSKKILMFEQKLNRFMNGLQL